MLGMSAADTAMDSTPIKGAKGTKGSIATWGGDITIYRDLTQPGSNKTLKTADITVSFLRLSELNADKRPVVDKNNRTHTMASFPKQNFSCLSSANSTMPYSSTVKADCWYCWTDFTDIFAPARFRTSVCIVQNNGTIMQQQEISNVSEGQVKLSIEMTKGWPWCDANCSGGMGKFIDLDIAIKLPSGIMYFGVNSTTTTTRVDNQPTKFSLGSGVNVEFSTMSLVDGTWTKLVDNTPALMQTNTTNTVTMRFARFETNLVYDPTFDTGSVAFNPNSSGRLAALSFHIIVIITMATVLVTSFMA